jgi:hypothetical protein
MKGALDCLPLLAAKDVTHPTNPKSPLSVFLGEKNPLYQFYLTIFFHHLQFV